MFHCNNPTSWYVSRSPNSFFKFFLFCFFFLSFLYPSHLSSEAHENSEPPTKQSWLKDMVTRVERAQVICFSSVYHIFYYFLLFSCTHHNNNIPYVGGRYLHVVPPIYYSPSRMPRSSSYTTTSWLDAISGVLPSLLLLLVHLSPFRCNRLNRRSRSIITRRAEGDEKKKRDVEWRWGEVRRGEVRSGEEGAHEENITDYVRKIHELLMAWRSAWEDLGIASASLSLMYASARSIHLCIYNEQHWDESSYQKSNFLKANKISEYKVISINLKFISSLLSYYCIIVDIFGEALSPLPSPLLT